MVISYLRIIPTIILITANLVLTVLYFKSLNENIAADFDKADTIKFLAVLRDLGSTTIMVFILISSYISSGRMSEELKKLTQIEAELRRFNLENSIKDRNYIVRKYLIVTLIIENFLFNFLGEIASAFVRESDRLMYLFVNMYPRLIIGLVNCCLYSVLMLIETRFELINELISAKIDKSHRVSKYPNEFDFCDNVYHLVSLHKILVKVSKQANSIFSFHALVCIAINFILLIGDLHTSMYIIFFDLFSKHHRIVLDMIKNCVTYIFELFYLAKRSSDLCNEANRSKVLLLGIRINIDKENERNAVIASVLKLMQNKLEITACKLFNIDNALLFSVSI